MIWTNPYAYAAVTWTMIMIVGIMGFICTVVICQAIGEVVEWFKRKRVGL